MNLDHFKILSNGYKNNKFKRKLAETLHIKHERPPLNVQEQSVPYSCSTDKVQRCSWNDQTSEMEFIVQI